MTNIPSSQQAQLAVDETIGSPWVPPVQSWFAIRASAITASDPVTFTSNDPTPALSFASAEQTLPHISYRVMASAVEISNLPEPPYDGINTPSAISRASVSYSETAATRTVEDKAVAGGGRSPDQNSMALVVYRNEDFTNANSKLYKLFCGFTASVPDLERRARNGDMLRLWDNHKRLLEHLEQSNKKLNHYELQCAQTQGAKSGPSAAVENSPPMDQPSITSFDRDLPSQPSVVKAKSRPVPAMDGHGLRFYDMPYYLASVHKPTPIIESQVILQIQSPSVTASGISDFTSTPGKIQQPPETTVVWDNTLKKYNGKEGRSLVTPENYQINPIGPEVVPTITTHPPARNPPAKQGVLIFSFPSITANEPNMDHDLEAQDILTPPGSFKKIGHDTSHIPETPSCILEDGKKVLSGVCDSNFSPAVSKDKNSWAVGVQPQREVRVPRQLFAQDKEVFDLPPIEEITLDGSYADTHPEKLSETEKSMRECILHQAKLDQQRRASDSSGYPEISTTGTELQFTEDLEKQSSLSRSKIIVDLEILRAHMLVQAAEFTRSAAEFCDTQTFRRSIVSVSDKHDPEHIVSVRARKRNLRVRRDPSTDEDLIYPVQPLFRRPISPEVTHLTSVEENGASKTHKSMPNETWYRRQRSNSRDSIDTYYGWHHNEPTWDVSKIPQEAYKVFKAVPVVEIRTSGGKQTTSKDDANRISEKSSQGTRKNCEQPTVSTRRWKYDSTLFENFPEPSSWEMRKNDNSAGPNRLREAQMAAFARSPKIETGISREQPPHSDLTLKVLIPVEKETHPQSKNMSAALPKLSSGVLTSLNITPPIETFEKSRRAIVLYGLPSTITDAQLETMVRGGKIDQIGISRDSVAARVKIQFVLAQDAHKLYRWYKAMPDVMLEGKRITAVLKKTTPMQPEIFKIAAQQGSCRYIWIKTDKTEDVIREEIKKSKSMWKPNNGIYKLERINAPLVWVIKFSQFGSACVAKTYFDLIGWKTGFHNDICSRPLSELPSDRTFHF
ncbi:hypothetical protein BZA77DRAFT_358528 [Pyronema omphalodes]|nr:hypothetical protein BZA77DRAFT_358528 [Pyronema omphalodes]